MVLCIMDTSGSMDTMKKYLARSFFFLLYQFICTKYQNVEIVFIAHHTEANEVTRGGVLPQRRVRRHVHLLRLPEGARHHRRALPPVALERLRVPLLRRRQLRLRQRGRAAGRARARRRLQPLRLRRDQAARLALLRELDAQRLPPSRRRQLPDRADRAQGGHLAELQGLPRQGPRSARAERPDGEPHLRHSTTSSTGTPASASRSTAFGLDCYPQEFELCDHNDMLGVHGLLRHAVALSALVVRQVVREAEDPLRLRRVRPALRDGHQLQSRRSPTSCATTRCCLQILTIAHVYGHNDFFKNNFTFRSTRAEFTHRRPSRRTPTACAATSRTRASASTGSRRILDAAHALSLQCRRNLAVRKLSRRGARSGCSTRPQPPPDPFHAHPPPRRTHAEPDLRKVPLEPDEDLLLFIRDHNPLPRRLGARSAHHRPRGGAVLHPADRDQDHERGLGVVLAQAHPRQPRSAAGAAPRVPRAPQPGGAAASRAASIRTTSASASGRTSTASPAAAPSATPTIFATRETDRDASFLRRYLTEELMRELDLFELPARGRRPRRHARSPTRRAGEAVKDTLIAGVGMNGDPGDPRRRRRSRRQAHPAL